MLTGCKIVLHQGLPRTRQRDSSWGAPPSVTQGGGCLFGLQSTELCSLAPPGEHRGKGPTGKLWFYLYVESRAGRWRRCDRVTWPRMGPPGKDPIPPALHLKGNVVHVSPYSESRLRTSRSQILKLKDVCIKPYCIVT